MDTSQPQKNEAPKIWRSRAASKTNTNAEGAELVAREGTECKHFSSPSIVFEIPRKKFWFEKSDGSWIPLGKQDALVHLAVELSTSKAAAGEELQRIAEEYNVIYAGTLAGHKAGIAIYHGARVLVIQDSPPLIPGRFPAVERADFSGHILDADRREKIANWFEQLKSQLPPAALKIVESAGQEALPKPGEVYCHRGSAASRRVKYYLFYGPDLWEFLRATFDEVRMSLEYRGFTSKRIAGMASEREEAMGRIRRENCVDEVWEVGEAPGVKVVRGKRVLILRGPPELQNALWSLRVLKGGGR